MKNVLFAVLQFLLFLLVFAVGSFLPPFHIQRILSATPAATHIFIWDGVLLATLLFAVILLIEAVRKRIQSAGLWTTAAFVLALLAGFAAKLGLLTIER
jgi:hypothetical protein